MNEPRCEKIRMEELKDDISAKINELLEEKKRIDEQLKKLRDVDVYSGCVKMGVRKPKKRDEYRGATPTYTLSFQYEYTSGEKGGFRCFGVKASRGF